MLEKIKENKSKIYLGGGVILLLLFIILLFVSCSSGYKVKLKVGASTYYQGNLKKGDTLEKLEKPKMEGYTFEGWYNGDEKIDLNAPIEEDLVLTAKFIKNIYTVTYVLDNGQQDILKEAEYGELVEELESPKKKGYLFTGWYNGEEKYDFNTTINNNLTLTAKWEKVTHADYKVEHYLMKLDGTYANEADEIEIKNDKIGTIVTPEVKSYEGFKSPKVQRKEVLEENELVIKYYYERNQYKLELDGTSGIDTLEGSGKYYYGEEVEIRATIKDGYTFAGWSNGEKKLDFTYRVEDDNEKFTALTTTNTYSITYDLNGGKLENLPNEYTVEFNRIFLGVPEKEGYTFSYWLINGKKTAGIINTGTTGNLEAKAIFKANTDTPYTIQYYYMDVNGQEYVLNKKQTKNRKGTTDTKIEFIPEEMEGFKTPILKDKDGQEVKLEDLVITGDGKTELNYYYEREKYTLTLEFDQGIEQVSGNGEYYYQEEIEVSATLKNGYSFKGWSNEEKNPEFTYTMKASSETLKATTSLNTYSIHYNLNGGSLENPINEYAVESDEFNLGVPTKEGYTFTHWLINGVESNGKIVKGTYGDLEVEAIFTANPDTPYMIHYYLMDVTGTKYDLKEDFTEAKTGTTDTAIEYTSKNIDGFKAPVLKDKDGKVVKLEDLVITGDGKTELNYYYERKQYTLTISFINELDSKDRAGVASISQTGTYYFETSVPIHIELQDGFELIGWSNGITDNEFSYTMTSNENQSLEAKIQRKSYTVHFDSNNGSNVESETVLFGKQIPQPINPSRDGHDFDGWFTNEECTEKWNFETDTMPNSNLTLYAKWNIHKNTVVFDANGGKFSDNKKTHDLSNQEVGSKITRPNENPAKEGYTFSGWYKETTGENEWTFEDDAMPDGALTLYAKWNANTYTIKFDGNGNTSGEMEEITCTYDQECQLTPNGYTKEYVVTYNENKNEDVENSTQNVKYNFENWSYQGKIYSNEDVVRNLTTEANGEVTFNAEWKIDSNTSSLKIVERAGYQFNGWYSNSQLIENLNNISTDLDLTAKWIANTYHVVYDGNKGNGSSEPTGTVESTSHTYDEPTELSSSKYSRDGYTFLGWSLTKHVDSIEECEDCITTANNLTDKNEGTITLYAIWKANTYTVIYNSNKGNGSSEPIGDVVETTHTYDTTTDLSSSEYSRDGYTFLGWSLKQYDSSQNECKDCIKGANNLTSELNGNITVYAVWKANTYTIIYDKNQGSGSIVPTGNVENTTHKYDVVSDLTKEKYSRTGYEFKGWSIDASSKDTIVNANNLTTSDTITLYAIWDIISYSLKTDSKGGNLANENKTTYTVEDSFELETPTKEGYTFDGWYKKNTNEKVDNITLGMTGNLDLEAHYNGIPYTVIYQNEEKEATRETLTYGEKHTAKDANTITKNYTVDFNSDGGNKVDAKTATATVKSWKIKDSSDGTTYVSGNEMEDLLIPKDVDEAITLIPAEWNYETISLPTATKEPYNAYLEYEFVDWHQDTKKYESNIMVSEDLHLTAHWQNVLNTEQYMKDNLIENDYFTSTLSGTNITAKIEKVNEKVTTIFADDYANSSSFIQKIVENTKTLLETPNVSSITLSYDSTSVTLTQENIYQTIKDLINAKTSTSTEDVANRKLSSLYSFNEPKTFALQINGGENTIIKGTKTNTITYTTTFTSQLVESMTQFSRLSQKVKDTHINSHSSTHYELVVNGDQLILKYVNPNANLALEGTGGLRGAGIKTAFWDLLGEPTKLQTYPYTFIESITLTFEGKKSMEVTAKPENVADNAWTSFSLGLAGDLASALGVWSWLSLTNSDLFGLVVHIKLNVRDDWALEDGFNYPLEYDITFQPK